MNHLPSLIQDLALILGAAAVTTLLFRWLKQPVVLGYIIAGLLVGPHFNLLPTVSELNGIRTWAEIGVVFLLFGLGLEFSFKKLIQVGGIALVTALFGVLLTLASGFFIGRFMGWSTMDALFLGGILSIASTTIIIRAFDELGVRQKKFTGIVTGVLIIEDLVAVVLMVMLSTISLSREFEGVELAYSLLKLIFFLTLWFVLGIFFIPTLLKSFSRFITEETLLIIALALCFLMVVLASDAGFSPALGAFVMGSLLAETRKAERIIHSLKPLKNLFGAIFFVSVGMLIDPELLLNHLVPVAITTLVLILGKPFFVTIGALVSGQPIRTAVQTGMSLSQIGEFSFIIASLGLSLGVTSDFLYPIAVAVSVVTAFTTPYMIRYSEGVAGFLERNIPQRWKDRLERYGAGARELPDENAWRTLIRFLLINTVVFSVLIFGIIQLGIHYLQQWLPEMDGKKLLIAGITLTLLSPFLWALSFRRTNKAAYADIWMKPNERGPLIILQLTRVAMSLFFLGFLFHKLFSPFIALLGVIMASALLFLFRQRIKRFYSRIELRFMQNMNARANVNKGKIAELSLWDAHFSSFIMDTESPIVGMTLNEAALREKFGVNVARIRRQEKIINAPTRHERIFPGDELVLIGTDEQLNRFHHFLESEKSIPFTPQKENQVSLRHFRIRPAMQLHGKSIRKSKIREQIRGLVVAIDRKDSRLLNPESSTVLQEDDILWVVGSARRIDVFKRMEEDSE